MEQTVTDLQLRYESKLRTARESFKRRFGRWPEAQRAEAIATLSSIPHLVGLVGSTTCPACGSPALVRDKEYDLEYGPSSRPWFSPRYFSCPVCSLILEGDELEPGELKLAGITGHFLSDQEEEEDPDWEPDADDRARLAE